MDRWCRIGGGGLLGLRGFNVAEENIDGWLNAIVTLLIVSGAPTLLVMAKTPA